MPQGRRRATRSRTPQLVELRIEPIQIGLPMVAADRTRFAQILMNLGSNAIKYNRPVAT